VLRHLSRFKRSLIPSLSVAFLFLFCLNLSTSACSCDGPGPTPCQAIGPHSTVFLGSVDSIETPSFYRFLSVASLRSPLSFRNQYTAFSNNVAVVFTVEEWFSGQPQKTARLYVTKSIGSCGYEFRPGDFFFRKGERYLVYADDKNGILSTNHCSKTRFVRDKNDAEIESLRHLHQLPSSVVTGTYAVASVYGPNTPLTQANVTLTSPGQRYTTKTDAVGGFTFSGLPPARYQVQFDTPPGYAVGWSTTAVRRAAGGMVPANPPELEVSAGSCRDASFTVLPDGRISGVATPPRGNLPEPIALRIWPADRVDAIENYWWAGIETDSKGTFQIGPLVPGRYVIGTYLLPADFKKHIHDSYYTEHIVPQAWFYPGTVDPAEAKPIVVAFAQHISGIRFVVPTAQVQASSKTDKP
jgi:hypothetical protein